MNACSIRSPDAFPARKEISVNGVVLPYAAVAAEAQNHAAASPAEAFAEAAQALVVRELLLQEAKRRGLTPEPVQDSAARRETDEDALIRALVAAEVPQDEPDEESCRRYFDNNRRRFRSADIYEAAHILIAATPETEAAALRATREIIARLKDDPSGFADAARACSACPSRESGGNLGQITRGQMIEEFESALFAMAPGEMSREPLRSRHGFHIIRLDRRIEGREQPFEAARARIASFLSETRERQAIAGFIAHLARQADIRGISLSASSRGA
ncbi:peptidylprolyl isomerase [Rhodoblastus sp.]|uniref:peptidylprolyl isomerase n=1 Tax=Rhodoblastus sp. TaxID=1962975 RepID=UPI002626786A|nr:peptidylprolyl isomerase [Rhodoblastus sp.]